MNSLHSMLQAQSVAVVGASSRPGSVGDQTMRQLIGGGFGGDIFPVNPSYGELAGLTCYPSLDRVEAPVDLVVLAVPNAHLEVEMEKAVAIGARSAVVFASCHGSASDGVKLRDRLALLAREAGMRICGGNGMGFLNVEDGLRVCGFYQPPQLEPGNVTFISHSGSLFSAMLHNHGRLRFNLVVSSGLEINTTMDDYVDWALGLRSTAVIGLFLETIRDPVGFREALAEADRRDIPIVALRVGASEKGRAAVATHSEAIAGDDAAYEALSEAHGIHSVLSMDEMVDALELFSSGRRVSSGGLGAVHDSGGERALLIDTADREGVDLPKITGLTRERVERVLDPGLEAENPIDAWGTGRGAEDVFTECLGALAGDPGIGVVAFCVDLTTEEDPDDAYSRAALATASTTSKPVVVIANVSTSVDAAQTRTLREGGVPVLHGTETALRAIRHAVEHGRRRGAGAPRARVTQVAEWADPSGGEAAVLAHLSGYGIAVSPHRIVTDEREAVEAGSELGFPIVVKALGVGHKSDVGGVILDVRDVDALADAYARIASRFGHEVLVAHQIPSGVELAFGMVRDPQFGPVVLAGAGGALVEVINDRVALMPPIDMPRARAALRRLLVSTLLDGARGHPASDFDAVADALVRFSELAADAPSTVLAIDVNPVIASASGAIAVDGLAEVGV